ncbi:hypothetical protein [Erwinia pyrifoliae]|uniref:hypothetical protein n=1 Tax=Erwinia pyrifoliae TaxID=79967 RepID=UPI0001C12FE1|nr:hypothetical protein [Erwinia pyrifoliae]MCT2385975.1 hypothetical protein [Erwinia pyrifoliae]CAY75754.1 hypothetical protein EPYR_03374 [Erwinia pyrifoliae DSM 12163]
MQILNPLHRLHVFLRRGWMPKLGLVYKAAPNVAMGRPKPEVDAGLSEMMRENSTAKAISR